MGGMYNMIFGVNPAAGVLLAMLGRKPSDMGRFRDAYVTNREGRPVIGIYTRNGGGNRQHWVLDEHDSWVAARRETVVYCRWDYAAGEWKSLVEGCPYGKEQGNEYDAHEPVAKEGIDCSCTGCTITYRIPAMAGYIADEDDDFDSTYCTVFFDPPDDGWRDLLAGLVREGDPNEDWVDFLAALQDPPEAPATRPQELAARMLAGLRKDGEQ